VSIKGTIYLTHILFILSPHTRDKEVLALFPTINNLANRKYNYPNENVPFSSRAKEQHILVLVELTRQWKITRIQKRAEVYLDKPNLGGYFAEKSEESPKKQFIQCHSSKKNGIEVWGLVKWRSR
jgi:hypothetical protein